MTETSRLAPIVEELHAVAPRTFHHHYVPIPERTGVSALVIDPIRRTGASLRPTDTGVSVYIEALGAHLEADSSDALQLDSVEPESFPAQLAWATQVAADVARFGLVRVRSRFVPLGRHTRTLRDADEALKWQRHPRFVVVGRWDAW